MLYLFQTCSSVSVRCPIYTLLMLIIIRLWKLILQKLFLWKLRWQRSTRDHHRWHLIVFIYWYTFFLSKSNQIRISFRSGHSVGVEDEQSISSPEWWVMLWNIINNEAHTCRCSTRHFRNILIRCILIWIHFGLLILFLEL